MVAAEIEEEIVVIGSFPTITVDILEKTLVHLLLQLPLSAVVNNMSRELELLQPRTSSKPKTKHSIEFYF